MKIVVHDPAADNGKDRLQLFDRLIRDFLRIEIVVAENDQVAELACFD